MSESQVAEGSVGRAQCNRSAVGGQRAFSTIIVGLYRFVTKHRAFFAWRLEQGRSLRKVTPMAQARWWPVVRPKVGNIWRSKKQARQVFLGSDIVLSGELTCCDTLVAEGRVESNRIECRHFVLGNAGSFKGVVQAESAVISGEFEGRLIIRARLLIRSGGQVRGSAQYGQIEIEPGGELQGDMLVYPSKHPAKDGLDLLAIAAGPKSEHPSPTGNSVSPTHKLTVAVPSAANGQLNGSTDKPAA